MARSLNDNVPVALINSDDVAAESDTFEFVKPADVDVAPKDDAPKKSEPENVAAKEATSEDVDGLRWVTDCK